MLYSSPRIVFRRWVEKVQQHKSSRKRRPQSSLYPSLSLNEPPLIPHLCRSAHASPGRRTSNASQWPLQLRSGFCSTRKATSSSAKRRERRSSGSIEAVRRAASEGRVRTAASPGRQQIWGNAQRPAEPVQRAWVCGRREREEEEWPPECVARKEARPLVASFPP
ncbi:hypothetical protein AAT19DRAFT_12249 [Rhodotorula toruloides]|uniref:Uncharacterized protein n=1 Tax=Rhodotorula toruloides TaxID=5286 RepID=A0A2T0AFP2_RHOTO|nr:hypothetical protein AAT19DRAFT_12249 [Rhodotorula toruloides]